MIRRRLFKEYESGVIDKKKKRKKNDMYFTVLKKVQRFKSKYTHIHYYNNIAYTKSPFYLSLFIFFAILSGIMYNAKIEYLVEYALVPLILFVAYIFTWINDLKSESVLYGRYNSKIRMSLMVGFILFLVSEAMLFLGFFWTFFDRLFALPAHVPQVYTIEHINCTGAPLLGTVLLILSGYCANLAFYQADSYYFSYLMHKISIVLGMAFLAIQVYEYQELMSSISYNVFYSIFFVLTGFHGFHVIIGLLFLIINDYIIYYNYSWSYDVEGAIDIISLFLWRSRRRRNRGILMNDFYIDHRAKQLVVSKFFLDRDIIPRMSVYYVDGFDVFYDVLSEEECMEDFDDEYDAIHGYILDDSEEVREKFAIEFTYDKPIKL